MKLRKKWLAGTALSVIAGVCVLLFGNLGATAEQTPDQKHSPQWLQGVQDVQPGEAPEPKKNLKAPVDRDKFHAGNGNTELDNPAKEIREHKMKPDKSDSIQK